MVVYHYFLNKTTKETLSARVTTTVDLRNKDRGNLTSDAQRANYLLRTYTTDKIIAEEDAEINQLLQPSPASPPEYSQELCSKALKSGTVYADYRFKGILLKVSTRRISKAPDSSGVIRRDKNLGVGATCEVHDKFWGQFKHRSQ